ncbi:MAG TPA: Clp protease N-terminal domain-containing protein [Vicinamibacterales bacterium]|nr:Clp protease N-terminal domain-containing protein [Vicinamibacterales bacterium]
MFERYTELARRVLFFARYEASQLGSINIETEHLLLGLLRQGKGLASQLFARFNVSLNAVRQDIEGRVVFHERVSTSVEIPFAPETKRVLQFAADEADRLNHNYIGTEHLLLGLLREEQCQAAMVLKNLGLTLADVRMEMLSLRESGHSDFEQDHHQVAPDAASSRGAMGQQTPHEPWPEYVRSDVVHISYSRYSRLAVGGRRTPESSPSNEEPPGFIRGTQGTVGWRARGAYLAELIAALCDVPARRVILTEPLPGHHKYDVLLILRTARGCGPSLVEIALTA